MLIVDIDIDCRFSTKIGQLKESGLIEHWIAEEQDKVARLANTEAGTAEVKPLSISNLQVNIEWSTLIGRDRPDTVLSLVEP